MCSVRSLAAGTLLCLIIAGCGGSSSKQPGGAGNTHVTSTGALATTTPFPTSFNSGYEQAWGQMKQVGAQILAAIKDAKRAAAKHQTVSDAKIASEFAVFASHLEPAVIELRGLTPPASVRSAFKSMASAAVGLAAALRSFSSDAAANRAAAGQRDLANYLAYATTIDNDATAIFDKLGLK